MTEEETMVAIERDSRQFAKAYEYLMQQSKIKEEIARQELRNRHYKDTKHEPIEVMREWMTNDQFIGFCLGNALKYLYRYNAEGAKGGILNIDKAIDYLEWVQEATTAC